MKKFNGECLWEVLGESERHRHYKCLCHGCGNVYDVSKTNLKQGKTRLCINCAKEYHRTRPKKTEHRLYGVWGAMIDRCRNPNHRSYKDYGGRGISVCERWENFWCFVDDMWETYEEGLTIDRENNEGNYCPQNCRWVSYQVQANNTRRALTQIMYEGELHTATQLAEKVDVKYPTIMGRIRSGWTDHEIVHGKPKPYVVDGMSMNQRELAKYLGKDESDLSKKIRSGKTLGELLDEFR